MFKTKLYLILIFFFLFSQLSFSQFFRPYIENFTQKQYGDSCNPQNWSITQDNNGIVYFGNNLRVLNFDGEHWNSIRTSEFGGFVSALFFDKKNKTIYVGSYAEFGKIIIDSTKQQKYISLSQNLNDNDAFFSNVWKIFKYNDNIVFFSQEKIFFLQNDSITVINPETSFHLAFVTDNKLFVRQRNIGLMQLKNKKFITVTNGDIFKDYGIFGIFKTSEKQKYLIITQELGAFYYYANKNDSAIIPINNNDKEILIKSNIFGGIKLSDGNIALNTNQNGIIIINNKAEIKYIINKNTGIKDNDIKQVFQDSNNDLWLAMNTGICRINYSSQVSNFNTNTALNGSVNTICIFNNNLISGTSEGLFEYNKKLQKFIKNPYFNKQILQVQNINNNLIISSENGLYKKTNNTIIKISDITNSKFYYEKNNKILFVAGKNKIEIYKHKNKLFILKKSINNIFINNITNIAFEKSKNDSLIFWIGSLNNGLIQIKTDNKLNYSIQSFTTDDGLSPGWINPLNTDKSVVFGTVTGLLKYTEIDSVNKNNDTTNIKYKGFFVPSDYLNLENDAINILKDTDTKIWLYKNGKIFYYNKQTKQFINKNFKSINIGKINTLYIYNNNIFIGGNEGISYVNINKNKNLNKKININIRKVSTNNKNIIYYGNDSLKNYTSINYSNNTITFYFSSLYIENGYTPKYSYIIFGYDKNWSEWTHNSQVKYKQLPPGDYIFKVKAKNIFGTESNIKEFKFTILPPFYRTFWAYIIYFILFIILIWIIIKIYTRKLEKDKQRLEQIIQERTVEIRKQKDEIESQRDKIIEIHSELKDSINYAQRIQQAVLPSHNYLNKILNDYFILFKPKDIVSGDFYWATKINEYVIITAADCTGHGVPGAFMSMLGTSFLNEIVKNSKIITANKILYQLRESIISALQQKGEEGEQKDGMDISLCCINTKTYEIQWAGANNPIYVITKNSQITSLQPIMINNNYKLYEIKPDKMPISIYSRMDNFTIHKIQLEKNDQLYMFSDGFADQFGGPKGKKFKYKPFKRLLLENAHKPMNEQKEILNTAFNNWKTNFEQIDDVIVIGIKL